MNAHFGIAASVKAWSAVLVQVRMVEAFSVLARTPMKIGPRKLGNAWMATVDALEIEPDLVKAARVDIEAHHRLAALRAEMEGIRAAREQHQREQANRDATRPRPTAVEVALADEALHWPMKYLRHSPLHCDALQLWASASAWNFSMARMLRERAEMADSLVQQAISAAEDDGRNHRAYEASLEERRDEIIEGRIRERVVDVDPKVERRQIDEDAKRAALRAEVMAKTIAWANDRIARARDPAHVAAIKGNARIRVNREMERADAKPARVKREDVMPGRCFTKMVLNKHRKEAAAQIARALNKDRVEVR